MICRPLYAWLAIILPVFLFNDLEWPITHISRLRYYSTSHYHYGSYPGRNFFSENLFSLAYPTQKNSLDFTVPLFSKSDKKMAAISGWVDGLRVGTVGVAVRFQLIYQSNTIKWDSFAITRTEKFDRYLSYKTDDDDLPATLCVAGNNYLLTYLLTYLLGTEIRILWTHTPVCTTCKHFWKVGAQKQVSLKVMKSRGSSLEV